MSSGYVFLYRCLLDKPIWINSTPEQCKILITLLLMANHQDKEWEWKGTKFKAIPGQFVTSLTAIAEKCGKGVTIQNIRTALVRFEKLKFLTDESTKTGRLITILNWQLYQQQSVKPNNEANRHLTDTQQRPNRQLTSNKNVKNVKNDNKDNITPLSPLKNKKVELKVKFAEFVSLTNDEYSSLVAQHGEDGLTLPIDESRGFLVIKRQFISDRRV